MSRFDGYATRRGVLLLDVQADLLSQLETRVVVPLMPAPPVHVAMTRLQPRFEIGGSEMLKATQFMPAKPCSELKFRVSNLQHHADEVMAAIGFLHQGW